MRWRITVITTLLAALGGLLSTSVGATGHATRNPDCGDDERMDQVIGFDSPASGARFNWTYRGLSAESSPSLEGHMNEVVWIGADNQSPDTTWVEVGIISGEGFNGVYYSTPRFYAARGFNGQQTDFYKLDNAPPATISTTHTVGAYNDGSGFHIQIDGAVYLNLPTPGRYTQEYDVGFEWRTPLAYCNGYLNRNMVKKAQSYRAIDGQWIQSDHGQLVHFGDGHGVDGMEWCSQPFKFRMWYQPRNDPNVCS